MLVPQTPSPLTGGWKIKSESFCNWVGDVRGQWNRKRSGAITHPLFPTYTHTTLSLDSNSIQYPMFIPSLLGGACWLKKETMRSERSTRQEMLSSAFFPIAMGGGVSNPNASSSSP